MKIKIWCDSGANAHSKRVDVLSLGDLGITEQEWKNMTEKEREAMAKEVAFQCLDWGYLEIE